MKVFIVNGYPTSGKSLFCEYCKNLSSDWAYEYSTVDFVKQIATYCGWDGTKNLQNRKFLSDLKDLLTEWDNVPYKKVISEIQKVLKTHETLGVDTDKLIFFVHCREPQEIQKFVDKIGAKTILVRRPEVEKKEQSNHADSNVLNYDYDYVICNNGTKDELLEEAKTFLDIIKRENWNCLGGFKNAE